MRRSSTLVLCVGVLLATVPTAAVAGIGIEPARSETGDPECMTDEECPPMYHCEPQLLFCVQCFADEHCPKGWSCDAATDACLDACVTDVDCEGADGATHCDADGHCRQCLESSHCAVQEWCGGLQCVPDACTPGTPFCFGHTIMSCGDDGGPDREIEQCAGDCMEVDDGPVCIGGATDDGTEASSDGSPSTGADDDGGADAGTSSGDAAETGATDGADSDAQGDDASDDASDDAGGCGCRPTDGAPPKWSIALVLAALARRRKTATTRHGLR
jgi:Cys-rich repeat protein